MSRLHRNATRRLDSSRRSERSDSFPGRLGLTFAENAVERAQPVAGVRLLRQPLRPQQIAELGVRADDAEGDVAGGELVGEIAQHARAGQIW